MSERRAAAEWARGGEQNEPRILQPRVAVDRLFVFLQQFVMVGGCDEVGPGRMLDNSTVPSLSSQTRRLTP